MPAEKTGTAAKEPRFTLGEHLEELRTRVILCVICLLVCFIVCWIFKADLLKLAGRPHSLTMEGLGLPTNLNVISYQEGFFAYLKLCLLSAFFLAYPFMIYQAWLFVGVGLYTHERRYVKIFLPISFVAFVTGALFGYLFLIPICLYFLITILGSAVEPIITMSQYISLIFLLTVVLGIVFQIPLVMLLLVKIGVCRAEDYITHRRSILLGVFVLAAIVTPPDPFSQVSTAVPMVGLYELGILLVKPTRTSIMYAVGVVAVVLLLVFGVYSYFTGLELGRVGHSDGTVTLSGPRDESTRGLRRGAEVHTGGSSRTTLSLTDDTRVHVNQQSWLTISGKRTLNLHEGEILLNVREGGGTFVVSTPSGRVNVEEDVKGGGAGRGIAADIKARNDTLVVTMIRGIATVFAEGERHTVRAGRQLTLSPGGQPVDVDSITNWTEGILGVKEGAE